MNLNEFIRRYAGVIVPIVIATVAAIAWIVRLETRVGGLELRGVPAQQQQAIDAINARSAGAIQDIITQQDEIGRRVLAAIETEMALRAFGERVRLETDDFLTPQLAETNGFVSIYVPTNSGNYGTATIEVKVGPTDNEADLIIVAGLYPGGDSAILPIKAGEYWMVDAERYRSVNVHWIPVFAIDQNAVQ